MSVPVLSVDIKKKVETILEVLDCLSFRGSVNALKLSPKLQSNFHRSQQRDGSLM